MTRLVWTSRLIDVGEPHSFVVSQSWDASRTSPPAAVVHSSNLVTKVCLPFARKPLGAERVVQQREDASGRRSEHQPNEPAHCEVLHRYNNLWTMLAPLQAVTMIWKPS